MTQVNFGFISGLEGGPILQGYVPDPKNSNSGVTIATGFDLGQRSA
ncbi:pesticin C-terminus-like muramidase, partial [Shewanella sp. S23-S33]